MDIQKIIEELYHQHKNNQDGCVSDYIPELARADPNTFAIVVVDVEGNTYRIGDTNQLFTIQSMSKPFTYGLALADHGRDYVQTRIGVEPTGQSFNSIILDERSGRPYNPMVNSGAIAVASLIQGADAPERLKRMLTMFKAYAGRDLHIDMPTFLSERKTGHRNRAIAHLMQGFGMLASDLDEALDLYFQQCALAVNCQDIATMAATIANGGQNPITGTQAIPSEYIRDLLSIMYTCGMYDSSGWWAYAVGLPAKSGVSGGIWGVAPGRMGIAVYSPLVDAVGHSVRGVQVFEALSRQLCLHVFDACGEHPLS